MSLAAITADLETHWNRQLRRHHPTRRWHAADPVVPADPAELRRRLDDRLSPAGRDLLARIVTLATGGDHDAALVATLALLGRIVRCEQRFTPSNSVHCVDYRTFAAAVWEAVVTEARPERRWLAEAIAQRAWRSVRKDICPYREAPALDWRADTGSSSAPVDDTAISHVAVGTLLDQLVAAGALNPRGRRIVEHLAAGGDGLRRDPRRGPRAAATERLRTVRPLRADARVRLALTA